MESNPKEYFGHRRVFESTTLVFFSDDKVAV